MHAGEGVGKAPLRPRADRDKHGCFARQVEDHESEDAGRFH
jgi:hypothetical protein